MRAVTIGRVALYRAILPYFILGAVISLLLHLTNWTVQVNNNEESSSPESIGTESSTGIIQGDTATYEKRSHKKRVEGSYEWRLENVRDACRALDMRGLQVSANFSRIVEVEKYRHLLQNILIDDRYKLLYCTVPKAGSTNWKRLLLMLQSNKTSNSKISPHTTTSPFELSPEAVHSHKFRTLADVPLRKVGHIIRTHYPFLFTRHPLHRLVSAFRDKLETAHPWDNWYRTHYATRIIKMFRNKSNTTTRLGPSSSPIRMNSQRANKSSKVTFPEFARFVASSEVFANRYGMDVHWERQWKLCMPCAIPYKFMGKLESIDEDSAMLIQKAGLQNTKLSYPSPTRRLSNKRKIYNNVEDILGVHKVKTSVTRKYLAQLDKETLHKLLAIYEIDFKMFGYDWNQETKDETLN